MPDSRDIGYLQETFTITIEHERLLGFIGTYTLQINAYFSTISTISMWASRRLVLELPRLVASKSVIMVISSFFNPFDGTCKSSLPSVAWRVGERVKRARVLVPQSLPVMLPVWRKDCFNPALDHKTYSELDFNSI